MHPTFDLAARLRAGRVFTGWSANGGPILEAYARAGFDSMVIDNQHGVQGFSETREAVGRVVAAGIPALVRTEVADWGGMSRALDLGAAGIIAPMINTVADAVQLVEATKYPALGKRSWGPARAATLFGLDNPAYFERANSATVTMAMIETGEALGNVDAILALPGIDAAFVGPSDLSLTLSGGKAVNPGSPEAQAAISAILAACRRAGKFAAIFAHTPEAAKAFADLGYDFIAIQTDVLVIRAGAHAALRVAKG